MSETAQALGICATWSFIALSIILGIIARGVTRKGKP